VLTRGTSGSSRRKRVAEQPQEASPPDRATIKRLLSLARPYWRQFALAAVCLVVATAVTLSLPIFIQGLVDATVVHKDPALMTNLLMLMLGVFLVQAVFTFGKSYLLSFIGERLVADLRKKVFTHLQSLSLGFYDNQRVGELTSRLSNDVTVVQAGLTNNLLGLLQEVLTLVGGLLLIILLDWRLLFVVAVVVLPIIAVGFFFGRRLERASESAQAALGETTTVLEEVLAAPRIVKAFGRERYEIGRYGGAVEESFRVGMARSRLRAGFVSLMTFSGFAALAAILWFGGNEVMEGRISPGQLFSLPIYIILATGPISDLTRIYAQIRESSGAGRRLFELLDTAPGIEDAPGAEELPARIRGEVEFRGASFRYGDGPEVLHDLSLRIEAGKVVALVGASGAGKTTMASVIPRFYDVEGGAVLVDGRDVKAVTLSSLRAQMAIVPQDPQLFGGSVRENIAYGQLDATQEEIERAAMLANAHGFISELPRGYDTIVGERGVKLSGGQRQRIAIARAVLRDPRILILDEATSSLDNESEALIKEALARLMQGRTVIIIAHRLSTVEHADLIAVLERGRVVEQGTHQELLMSGGLYHKLYMRSAVPLRPGEGAATSEVVEDLAAAIEVAI
jgi:subfamily B ATP-binding cassette protein MsbA